MALPPFSTRADVYDIVDEVMGGQSNTAGGIPRLDENGRLDPSQVPVNPGFGGAITKSSDLSGLPDNVYVSPTESGTYTNAGGLTYDPENTDKGYKVTFIKSGAEWFKDRQYIGAEPVQIDKGIFTKNEVDTSFLVQDTVINSLGEVNAGYVGFASVVGQPVVGGQAYTISGDDTVGRYFAFKNSEGNLTGSVITITELPRTVTSPSDAVTLDYTYINITVGEENWGQNLMIEKGSIDSEFEEPLKGILEINSEELVSKGLKKDNYVPYPSTKYSAVNKQYFEENSITESDLSIETTSNLFNPELIINGQYIKYDGSIASLVDWKMIGIPVSSGLSYTFGNIFITSPLYSAFYNSSNDLVAFNGEFNSGQTKTYLAPSGASILYIGIKRATDPDSGYSTAIVNEGTVLSLPYEPYTEFITEIKGKMIKGGGNSGGTAYDQSLNTTDNVSFESISANGMTLFIPEGSTEPSGLISVMRGSTLLMVEL